MWTKKKTLVTVVFENRSCYPIEVFESQPLDQLSIEESQEGVNENPSVNGNYSQGIKVRSCGKIIIEKPIDTWFRFWNNSGQPAMASFKVPDGFEQRRDFRYDLYENPNGGNKIAVSTRLHLSADVLPDSVPEPSIWTSISSWFKVCSLWVEII